MNLVAAVVVRSLSTYNNFVEVNLLPPRLPPNDQLILPWKNLLLVEQAGLVVAALLFDALSVLLRIKT